MVLLHIYISIYIYLYSISLFYIYLFAYAREFINLFELIPVAVLNIF